MSSSQPWRRCGSEGRLYKFQDGGEPAGRGAALPRRGPGPVSPGSAPRPGGGQQVRGFGETSARELTGGRPAGNRNWVTCWQLPAPTPPRSGAARQRFKPRIFKTCPTSCRLGPTGVNSLGLAVSPRCGPCFEPWQLRRRLESRIRQPHLASPPPLLPPAGVAQPRGTGAGAAGGRGRPRHAGQRKRLVGAAPRAALGPAAHRCSPAAGQCQPGPARLARPQPSGPAVG